MRGAQPIPRTRADLFEISSQYADTAILGNVDAAQQSQQGTLAAATRAVQKNPLTDGYTQFLDIQARRCLTGPTETQVIQFDSRRKTIHACAPLITSSRSGAQRSWSPPLVLWRLPAARQCD